MELADGEEEEPCNDDHDDKDDEDDVEDREEDGEAWFFLGVLFSLGKMELKRVCFMLFFCNDFDLNEE